MLLRKAWQYQNSEIDAGGVIGLYVLELGRDLKASDPRDKVYGFLGLTRVGIIPDYKKDVREVYIETALHLLRLTGITQTLNLAGMENEQKFELPSWVPNWTSRRKGLYLKQSFFDIKTVGDIMSDIDSSEEGVLKVIGLQLSSVAELEPELSQPLDDSGRVTTRTWHFCRHYLANHGSKPYHTGIPFLQAMMRLLLDDEDPLNSDSKISIPTDAFFKLGTVFIGVLCANGENTDLEFVERCHRNLPKLGLDPDVDFAKTFSKQFLGDSEVLGPWENATQALYGNFAAYLTIFGVMGRAMRNRCLFCTEDGWIGIGPEDLMKGDLVCAVKNCKFPVLLRPEDDHFLLLGTALIHGLMDGAIFAELESRSSSVQEFKIW
ncbi:hypothetical protein L207DRAFT_628518 [Hyaloscypha variabilis F]|uniref:Heterokaryon incompatibility domain-containing protein n=1 Tax=Hyaloscypha variabilis (strain UAMH 11265 / GT02V1 / F) TaxID=1149755 RepID=A0A2J6SB22_HYAVF|nr:hypothetical protein L207DRAFT_628518 [Hyaloscypha variabilis F]